MISLHLDAADLDEAKFNGERYLDKWKRALEAKDRILLDCGLQGRIKEESDDVEV